jgi:hypothetical protein
MNSSHGDLGLPPPLTPPHKGERDPGTTTANCLAAPAICCGVSKSPSPLWGGARGGGISTMGSIAT